MDFRSDKASPVLDHLRTCFVDIFAAANSVEAETRLKQLKLSVKFSDSLVRTHVIKIVRETSVDDLQRRTLLQALHWVVPDIGVGSVSPENESAIKAAIVNIWEILHKKLYDLHTGLDVDLANIVLSIIVSTAERISLSRAIFDQVWKWCRAHIHYTSGTLLSLSLQVLFNRSSNSGQLIAAWKLIRDEAEQHKNYIQESEKRDSWICICNFIVAATNIVYNRTKEAVEKPGRQICIRIKRVFCECWKSSKEFFVLDMVYIAALFLTDNHDIFDHANIKEWLQQFGLSSWEAMSTENFWLAFSLIDEVHDGLLQLILSQVMLLDESNMNAVLVKYMPTILCLIDKACLSKLFVLVWHAFIDCRSNGASVDQKECGNIDQEVMLCHLLMFMSCIVKCKKEACPSNIQQVIHNDFVADTTGNSLFYSDKYIQLYCDLIYQLHDNESDHNAMAKRLLNDAIIHNQRKGIFLSKQLVESQISVEAMEELETSVVQLLLPVSRRMGDVRLGAGGLDFLKSLQVAYPSKDIFPYLKALLANTGLIQMKSTYEANKSKNYQRSLGTFSGVPSFIDTDLATPKKMIFCISHFLHHNYTYNTLHRKDCCNFIYRLTDEYLRIGRSVTSVRWNPKGWILAQLEMPDLFRLRKNLNDCCRYFTVYESDRPDFDVAPDLDYDILRDSLDPTKVSLFSFSLALVLAIYSAVLNNLYQHYSEYAELSDIKRVEMMNSMHCQVVAILDVATRSRLLSDVYNQGDEKECSTANVKRRRHNRGRTVEEQHMKYDNEFSSCMFATDGVNRSAVSACYFDMSHNGVLQDFVREHGFTENDVVKDDVASILRYRVAIIANFKTLIQEEIMSSDAIYVKGNLLFTFRLIIGLSSLRPHVSDTVSDTSTKHLLIPLQSLCSRRFKADDSIENVGDYLIELILGNLSVFKHAVTFSESVTKLCSCIIEAYDTIVEPSQNEIKNMTESLLCRAVRAIDRFIELIENEDIVDGLIEFVSALALRNDDACSLERFTALHRKCMCTVYKPSCMPTGDLPLCVQTLLQATSLRHDDYRSNEIVNSMLKNFSDRVFCVGTIESMQLFRRLTRHLSLACQMVLLTRFDMYSDEVNFLISALEKYVVDTRRMLGSSSATKSRKRKSCIISGVDSASLPNIIAAMLCFIVTAAGIAEPVSNQGSNVRGGPYMLFIAPLGHFCQIIQLYKDTHGVFPAKCFASYSHYMKIMLDLCVAKISEFTVWRHSQPLCLSMHEFDSNLSDPGSLQHFHYLLKAISRYVIGSILQLSSVFKGDGNTATAVKVLNLENKANSVLDTMNNVADRHNIPILDPSRDLLKGDTDVYADDEVEAAENFEKQSNTDLHKSCTNFVWAKQTEKYSQVSSTTDPDVVEEDAFFASGNWGKTTRLESDTEMLDSDDAQYACLTLHTPLRKV